MRRMPLANTSALTLSIPRGWVVIFAALASWALAIAVGAGLVQMFQFVMAAF